MFSRQMLPLLLWNCSVLNVYTLKWRGTVGAFPDEKYIGL